MKLIVDYANLEKIKEMYMYYPVDGVTTNPSILAKEKRNPYEVLKEIREFISKDGRTSCTSYIKRCRKYDKRSL